MNTNIKLQGTGEKLYTLVNIRKGGGTLIELMKEARETKDYIKIDEAIGALKDEYLYDDGTGQIKAIDELIKYRRRSRQNDKEKKINNDEWKDTEIKIGQMVCLNKVCWKLGKRGTLGETILHLCILNTCKITRAHSDLAKRLLHHYPNMVNDMYAGDEYYGETALHLAIANEDPAMVKFLLDQKANCHVRACGTSFFPDDQKQARKDITDYEWIDIPKDVETNYVGHLYFGEYPLSFAVSLGQEECVRLLINRDDYIVDLQDANGNTALHMSVIHDKKDMFDLVKSLGGDMYIENNHGLTPLTLAAKLASSDMYDHILEIHTGHFWKYGDVICGTYPLKDVDTISPDGTININSALNIIANGDKEGHLDMVDGLIVNLLQTKWQTFIRYRFHQQLMLFAVYFVLFAVAFGIRPGRDLCVPDYNITGLNYCNVTTVNKTTNPCYLLMPYRNLDIVRFLIEIIVVLLAIYYVCHSVLHLYHNGIRYYLTTLKETPDKTLFILSCVCVIVMVPARFNCSRDVEEYIAFFSMLCITPYFLFFCRGFQIVGPFVVMIYEMIKGDLLRFAVIYLTFLVGYSQAMYVIMREEKDTPFNTAGGSISGLFDVSMGQFADYYDTLNGTKHHILGKILCVVYMILAAILVVNMLIAMMAHTYQNVAKKDQEWLRQWARIVLVVERSLSKSELKDKQLLYAEETSNRHELVFVARSHEKSKTLEYVHDINKSKLRRRKKNYIRGEHRIHSTFDAI